MERVWRTFDGYCRLWAAHLARCGNCVSGVRSLDLILAKIREPGRSLQSRGRKRKSKTEGERERECRGMLYMLVLICSFMELSE